MKKSEEGLLRGGQFRFLLNRKMMSLCSRYCLKRAEIEVLLYLHENPEHNTAKDIQNYLYINKGYVSQIVDSLHQNGYLTATPDEKDRRFVHYAVTDKTAEIAEDFEALNENLGEKLFEGVSEEERKTFQNVAEIVFGNIVNMLKE